MNAPYAPAVPAEFTGLARQFIRDCDREDDAASNALAALLAPVQDRLDRLPGRQLRPGDFKALAAGWRAVPHTFRLLLTAETDARGRRGRIAEVRVHPCRVEVSDWAEGADEPGLLISVHRLKVPTTRRRVIASQMLANVGLHALGRRFERGRDRSHPAVLRDLAKLIQADMFDDLTRFHDGERIRLATACGGAWLGTANEVTTTDDGDRESVSPQFVIRTFISAEQQATLDMVRHPVVTWRHCTLHPKETL